MGTVYTATVTVTGGRSGHARSDDGILDIDLVAPKDVSAEKKGTNPEQLFAAGYAACFESALRATARRAGKSLTDLSIHSAVSLLSAETGGYQLGAVLDIKTKGISQNEAEELAQKVHADVCPYSKAVRGNIDVTIKVTAT
jgi:osmotically inducible protein OsmC